MLIINDDDYKDNALQCYNKSGFTAKQRHDVIMSTLKELTKGSQAFQLRWKENSGEYLTVKYYFKRSFGL